MVHSCPNCTTRLPLFRLFWGHGRPFVCRNCDTRLIIPISYAIPLKALLAFYLLKPFVQGGLQIAALIAALAIIVQILTLVLLPARGVKE